MIEDDRPRTWRGRRWTWIFLLLTGALSSTILLKIGRIQYLELIYACQLILLLCLLVKHDLKLRLFPLSLALCTLYFAFMVAALVLSLVALRSRFYYPASLTILKHPVWITVSRSVELAIDAGIMIYLVQVFRRDRRWLAFTMKIFWWAGAASALYSVLCYPLSLLHLPQTGVYAASRMRGFYNEGGPYGLYLLSAILVGVALYNLQWVRRGYLRAGLVLMLVAFVGSQSKAAVAAFIVLMLVNTLMIRGFKARLVVLTTFAVGAVVLSVSVNLPEQVRTYQRNAAVYERLSNLHSNDGNFVFGRVAGAFIVPRIIAAHPLTGVGWGNYGLVRNNPVYRGASAWVGTGEDEPSLGLLGEVSELGVPLALLLLLCLTFPYLYLRHINAPLYIKNVALIQPIIHTFGGQLNLTYPWVVTAFALGVGYLEVRSAQRAPVAAAPLLSGSPVPT